MKIPLEPRPGHFLRVPLDHSLPHPRPSPARGEGDLRAEVKGYRCFFLIRTRFGMS